MSACEILLANPTKHSSGLTMASGKEREKDCVVTKQVNEDITSSSDAKAVEGSETEKEKPKGNRIMYTKDELLELRSAAASLMKPDCLIDEFFVKNGVWDPEAWHHSSCSRSASPVVDGKCVTFEQGKKIELLDNNIELAPHRRSFCQGCHVQSSSEAENSDKGASSRRLGGRAGLGNDSKGLIMEGKDRLTGRASSQRKNMEKSILKDRILTPGTENERFTKVTNNNQRMNFESTRFMKDRIRNYKENGMEVNRERKSSGCRDFYSDRKGRSNDALPEWMIDGPSSQADTIELKGFDVEIEEERKAVHKIQKKANDKVQTQTRNRKSSKGSSRSSTPAENKQRRASKTELQISKTDALNGEFDEKVGSNNNERRTPTDKIFDDNGLFDLMDYLPTHLFSDDYSNEAATRSKFSQWFQPRSGSSSDSSRPNSVPLNLDSDQIKGFASNSPTIPMQYFTPIQPAPASQVFERPIPVSPLTEIFPTQKSALIAKPKEVKGRVTVDQIEQEFPKPIGYKPKPNVEKNENKTMEQTAFDKLVFTMKAAGQLPEKPAPVISGLPEHLLPKPPRKTSPCFEKLKRALSRSPSPVNPARISPISFLNRPVSPLMSTVPERLLSPEFFKHTRKPRSTSPATVLDSFHDSFADQQLKHRIVQQQQESKRFEHGSSALQQSNHHRFNGGLSMQQNLNNATPQQSKLPTAFLPTSVIKKMHNEKHENKERSDTINSNGSYTKVDLESERTGEKMGLASSVNEAVKGSTSMINDSLFYNAGRNQINPTTTSRFNDMLLGQRNLTANSLPGAQLPQKSAPTSPHSRFFDAGANKVHNSAPATPQHPFDLAFQTQQSQHTDKTVESTSAFSRPQDQPSSLDLNVGNVKENADNTRFLGIQHQHSVRSELFEDQGRPSDSGAGKVNKDLGGINPTTQARTFSNPQLVQSDAQKDRIHLPTASRPAVTQQNQRPQHRLQANQFNRGRGHQQNGPRLPVPLNQPSTLASTLSNRPNIPAATAAMAAQIVHHQLLQQAARAHALQAAQALQQQQQQQNFLRTQMQAVMAQAYVREQAAKALMYNPRAVASNLQAVAQQMGLRAPQPLSQNRTLPTPLLNQAKEVEKTEVQTPRVNETEEASTKESPLSKWFNVDALQKSPPAPKLDQTTKAKVISVEDLEKSQR